MVDAEFNDKDTVFINEQQQQLKALLPNNNSS